MPAVRLASLVFQCKGENSISFLNGIFSFGVGRCNRAVDDVEGRGGGKGIWKSISTKVAIASELYLPFLKDILGGLGFLLMSEESASMARIERFWR